MYVIRNRDTGKYVAKPGSLHSYTTDLKNAHKFEFMDQASRSKCDNEQIVSLDSAGGLPSLNCGR